MGIKEEKQAVRDTIKTTTKMVTFYRTEASDKVINDLKKLDIFIKAKSICIYKSFHNEIDTMPIIKESLKLNKKVYLPKITPKGMELQELERLIGEEDGLDIFKYGNIYEGDVELILVPGVAFDHERNRLGRGQGNYDKYLSEHKTYSIGLAFMEQVVEKLPIEDHDQKVNLVIFG